MPEDPFEHPGNAIGVHARLFAPDWSEANARSAVHGAADAGFDLIEIPAEPPTAALVARTSALLAESGLASVVSLALGHRDDITDTDREIAGRGEARLTQAVDFARDIGASYVGGVLYSRMGMYDAPASAAARRQALDVLRRVAGHAAGSGIRLGLEYVNRYESNLLNTAAQTVAFIEELGAENVVLHLDTYHVNVEEAGQAAAVRDAGRHLAYIHAAENHRGALGTGSIDWPALFSALAAAGFTGPITVESFSPAVVDAAMVADVGLWRELWSDPTALAAAARVFVTDGLAAARLTRAGLAPAHL